MKRRVVEQGGLTLMISLPRKWAKQHQLKKGDELELVERGKELILSTPMGIEAETGTVVEISDAKKFMGRLVQTPYRFGYNEVEFKYSDSSVVPHIQRFLEQLLGFEIVEQGANHMKVEMVAKEMETEFEKMLRRLMMMILDMAKEMAAAAKEKDAEKLKEIASREMMTNRLSNFCERLLNKHGYSEIRRTSFMYCTVWALEQVADEVREMCNEILSGNVGAKTLSALDDFAKYIDVFIKVFYKHSNEDLWAMRERHHRLMDTIHNIDAKKKEEFRVLALMISSAEKMRHVTFSLS